MADISFSPTEAIGFGWNTYMKRKKFWLIAAIFLFTLGGARGNINLGNVLSRTPTTPVQKQQSPLPIQNTLPPLNPYQNTEVAPVHTTIPLVPEKVDKVLGISDQREKGNYLMYIGLLIFALFVFSLPFIIMVSLVYGCVQMGFIKFFLTAVKGAEPQYEMILSDVNLWKSFRFLAASFLYGLLVVVGLLFFIIPGIYFGIKYAFVTAIIADKDKGIAESFSLSALATKGNKWNLLGLGILMMLLNIGGCLALLYGLLVTFPVSSIAFLYAYNKLSQHQPTE